MIPLSFPEPDFKVQNSGRGPEIWDRFRKKWVMLQPEEWVRQNVLNWLVKVHQIPESLISVEKGLQDASKKRYDILVFNQSHQPWMMVECKSTETMLDESVLMQILSYHSSVQVNYIAITNGHQCHIAALKKANQIWLASFPIFEQ
ncbi:MAG: type I restriction enzyme HsdR N-terminal domain-containing protein [Bacteroidota bacterium]|jgi:hypothetical protein